MSRTNSKRINENLIRQNFINPYFKSPVESIGLHTVQKSQPHFQPVAFQSSSMVAPEKTIRLNIINKQQDSEKISIITKTTCPISQLKRLIESQFYELNNKSILIKVLEDSRGFIFSNNSIIGDHVQNGDTIYFVLHNSKEGANMNLPANITDIFMTLRYVSKSAIKKISQVKNNLSLREVLPELIALGFWYSNSELVVDFLKLVNEMLNGEEVSIMQKGSGEILQNLIVKFLGFWLLQIPNAAQIYPDVFQQVLIFIQKLSSSQYFANLLKSTKITKKITELCKNTQQNQTTKISLNIMKKINGKNRYLTAPTNLKFQYNPINFADSNLEAWSLQQALQMLEDKQDQMNQFQALQIFADVRNNLCLEATVRCDLYWKLINGVLNIKSFKEKKHLKNFAIILEELNKNTSEGRASQLLDRNLLKKLHDFLLGSPVETHQFVFKYIQNLLTLGSKNGQLSIKKICQLFNSPYENFLVILCEALQKNNQFHTKKGKDFTLIYINNIKDFIRMALKSQNPLVSRPLLKILSNLSLDEECRCQIINLKGIQIFIKLLQTNRQNIELQRICAKGLLNLAISSKEVKVKVLAQMTQVIQMYYKRQLDSIAAGYVQTILKTVKA